MVVAIIHSVRNVELLCSVYLLVSGDQSACPVSCKVMSSSTLETVIKSISGWMDEFIMGGTNLDYDLLP